MKMRVFQCQSFIGMQFALKIVQFHKSRRIYSTYEKVMQDFCERKCSRLNSIYGPYLLNVSFCCFIFGHLSHPPTKHHIHCGVLAKHSYVQQQSSKPLIISLVEIIATQINGKCMNVIFCLYVYKRINNIFQRRKSSYVDDNLELFHLIRPIYIFLHPKSNKPSTS